MYSEHKLKKIPGFIEISIKEIVSNKMTQISPEIQKGRRKFSEEENNLKADDALPPPSSNESKKNLLKIFKWSRLPTQSCKIPNKVHKSFGFGKNSFTCLQFSRSGIYIAAGMSSKIFIYDVISCEEVNHLTGHIGYIYEIDWSFNDKYLLSVSNDCQGIIWSLNQKNPLFILPHPSFIYCGRWVTDEEVITGGKDHLIRYWCKNTGEEFNLVEEIGGHSGFISCLVLCNGSLLISGDSLGFIMIRKLIDNSWILQKKLSFPETCNKVIDFIAVQSSQRRIIISVRSQNSYLVDFVSGIILQTYKSLSSSCVRSVSTLTPCGSYLFSFCQNGNIGVWEVNTGKFFASYNNLFPNDRMTELSGCMHYHPFEHMIGITVLIENHPLLVLKYDVKENDSKKLGLDFFDKKFEKIEAFNYNKYFNETKLQKTENILETKNDS